MFPDGHNDVYLFSYSLWITSGLILEGTLFLRGLLVVKKNKHYLIAVIVEKLCYLEDGFPVPLLQ